MMKGVIEPRTKSAESVPMLSQFTADFVRGSYQTLRIFP